MEATEKKQILHNLKINQSTLWRELYAENNFLTLLGKQFAGNLITSLEYSFQSREIRRRTGLAEMIIYSPTSGINLIKFKCIMYTNILLSIGLEILHVFKLLPVSNSTFSLAKMWLVSSFCWQGIKSSSVIFMGNGN